MHHAVLSLYKKQEVLLVHIKFLSDASGIKLPTNPMIQGKPALLCYNWQYHMPGNQCPSSKSKDQDISIFIENSHVPSDSFIVAW